MIAAALNLLERPDDLSAVLKMLGGRHKSYGVTASHYDRVGEALVTTLHQCLRSSFTNEARAAWTALYGHSRRTMLDEPLKPLRPDS